MKPPFIQSYRCPDSLIPLKQGNDYQERLSAHANILPQHKQTAERLIVLHLGYLPSINVSMQHEIFIRAELEMLHAGQTSRAKFAERVHTHIRHIRNEDMHAGGWARRNLASREDDYAYEHLLGQYREKARKRLCDHLGYVPIIYHSYTAELMLRRYIHAGLTKDDGSISPADYKAMAITDYRKIMFTKKRKDADASLLLALNKTDDKDIDALLMSSS